MTNQAADPAFVQFWRQRGEAAGRTIGQRINSYGPAIFEYEIDLHNAYMRLNNAGRAIAEEAYLAGFASMIDEEEPN